MAAAAGRIFVEAIAGELRRAAGETEAEHGAIMFPQRFGGSLTSICTCMSWYWTALCCERVGGFRAFVSGHRPSHAGETRARRLSHARSDEGHSEGLDMCAGIDEASSMLHACLPTRVLFHAPTPWSEAAITVVSHEVIRRFVRGAVPPDIASLYGSIAAEMGIHRAPELIWVQDAAGYGGVHGGTYIVLGEADLRRIAADVWQGRFVQIHPSMAHLFPKTARRDELMLAAARILIAHELGHAFRARSGISTLGVPEEYGADVVTGWVAERLGWSAWLDELIMDHIGCRAGDACGHPSPAGRVKAYREGREACREQVQQELRQQQAVMAYLMNLSAPYMRPVARSV